MNVPSSVPIYEFNILSDIYVCIATLNINLNPVTHQADIKAQLMKIHGCLDIADMKNILWLL